MPMTLTSSRASVGLQAKFTPTNTNVSGSIQIGANNESISFDGSNAIYSLQAFFGSASSAFTLNQSTGVTSAATTWVAGTAQVETATASGTATSSGNVSVTVTAAGMSGSPKTISVPILINDTGSQWAEKVRTALAADADVSARFAVSGATDLIVLTRKPTKTIAGSNVSVSFYAANDSTLNIALSAGTTGVTSAVTSTNTTAGVASSGTLIFDGDGKDIEGNTIGTLTADAALFKAIGCGVTLDNSTDMIYPIGTDGILFGSKFVADDDIVIAADAPGAIQITILGTI
jgi:hypothetical protein